MKPKTATQQKNAVVVYVPVLHQGYLNLFKKHSRADLLIVDREILKKEFRSIQKDIRALETELIINFLKIIFPRRKIIHLKSLKKIDWQSYHKLIFPEDEISQWLVDEFFSDLESSLEIERDSIFLRWSQAKTKQKKDLIPDEKTTVDKFQRKVMGQLVDESQKSGDWWRQTAAAIAKKGQLIAVAHNQHAPSDQQAYIFGDPRANSSRGSGIEVTTALHAEEVVIAQAAREGTSLKGADLYVTTFPCPYCARLIAYSGVKRLFYKEGYSLLDGAELLKSRGIELIRVKF